MTLLVQYLDTQALSEPTQVDSEESLETLEAYQTLHEAQSHAEGFEAFYETYRSLEDTERLIELSEGLECLKSLSESIHQATLSDVKYIHTATQLALAGTHLQPQQVFPALEDSLNGCVSTESIGQMISGIWQSIVKAVKRTWQALRKFFGYVYDRANKLHTRNDKMRDRFAQVKDHPQAHPEVVLKKEIRYLTCEYKVPRNARDIERNLKGVHQEAEQLLGQYTQKLIKAGQSITRAIQGYKKEQPEKSIQAITQAAQELEMDTLAKRMGASTTNEGPKLGQGQMYQGKPLTGNQSLFYFEPNIESSNNNALYSAEQVRKRQIRLDDTTQGAKQTLKETRLPTLDYSQAMDLYEVHRGVLDILIAFKKQEAELVKVQNGLENAAAQLTRRLESDRNLPETSRTYYRAAVKFNQAFALWVAHPQSALMKLMLQSVNTSLHYCQLSIGEHKAPDKADGD